jgi:signal transduction histidine kinase
MTDRTNDLAGALAAAVEAARPTAEARGIRLTAAYDDLEGSTQGTGLPQLLRRLVAAVIQLTPDGGKVHARLSRLEERAHVVLISTGEALPDGELAAARKVVERLGGSIDVYADDRGGGATLGILLQLS